MIENIIETNIGDYKLYTADQIDGYGLLNVTDAISVIIHMLGLRGITKVDKALEWCCGPAYFGFGLKYKNLANHITVSDVFEPLEKIVNDSIHVNNLEDEIQFVLSNNFENIDDSFDLIIGNPPHFNFELPYNEETIKYHEHRKHMDLNWDIHRDFFKNVSNHLNDNGSIILMENKKGSQPNTFIDMIEDNNLQITNVIVSQEFPDDTWYMEVRKK